MSEKLSQEKTAAVSAPVVSLDPFGCPVVKHTYRDVIECDPYIHTLGVRPCKDDPTRTEIYEAKKESIQDIINVNADKVGIKAMLRAVALGEISAASLADDGQSSIDLTPFSGYVPPASALAEQSADVIKKYQEQLPGLDQSNFEKLINDAVEKKIAEIQAKNASAAETKGE